MKKIIFNRSKVMEKRTSYLQLAGTLRQAFIPRLISSTAATRSSSSAQSHDSTKPSPLAIMPTNLLLRSYFVTSVISSPQLLKIFLPLMHKIANSQTMLYHPDRNPVIHFVIRKFVYDHFTAGETMTEVKKTIAGMKEMGFQGVILGYAREFDATEMMNTFCQAESSATDRSDEAINIWRDGNLKTLSMIGEGDILAVKYSGAGSSTLEALKNNRSPPPKMWKAMLDICEAANKQNSRLWIDAEQQYLQRTIDKWTIELMRKYNTGGKAVIYTTMQAYLKRTSENISEHLKISQAEGWKLGIKLVRGAYIATEQRDLIHDTIEDTHAAYNKIVEQLLLQEYPGISSELPYPRAELFLATHNDESIKRCYQIQKSVITAGKSHIELGYGQLQGMADEISCGLLQRRERGKEPACGESAKLAASPQVFKCLTYGSTQECLKFLLRRVKENSDALGRTKYWVAGFQKELWRRFTRVFGL